MKLRHAMSCVATVALLLVATNVNGVWAQSPSDSVNQEDMKTTLLRAVQGRDTATVRSILHDDPELAASSYGPDVPLMLIAAFTKDEHGFVKYEENVLVSIILPRLDNHGIFEACIVGNLKRTRELIEENPSLADTVAPSDWTLMHFAAFSGNAELIKYLYEQGCNIHARAWKSSAIVPLLSGMLVRRYEASKLLLDLGADPQVRERGGFSAMHEASLLGDTAMIRLLHDRGAELNSRRDTGERPIDLAVKHDHTAAIALLRQLGADE